MTFPVKRWAGKSYARVRGLCVVLVGKKSVACFFLKENNEMYCRELNGSEKKNSGTKKLFDFTTNCYCHKATHWLASLGPLSGFGGWNPSTNWCDALVCSSREQALSPLYNIVTAINLFQPFPSASLPFPYKIPTVCLCLLGPCCLWWCPWEIALNVLMEYGCQCFSVVDWTPAPPRHQLLIPRNYKCEL